MPKRGKKYRESAGLYEAEKQYDSVEALELVQKTAKANFDETVEISVKLGVDPRHADQQGRGAPDVMNVVGRLGKVLGPKGLMPNPKSGTVTFDLARAIAEIKAGKIEYRLDKTSIIHAPIGKVSFGTEKLVENYRTLMEAIIKAKPAAAKGQYLRSIVVSSTMGPGIKINTGKPVD